MCLKSGNFYITYLSITLAINDILDVRNILDVRIWLSDQVDILTQI